MKICTFFLSPTCFEYAYIFVLILAVGICIRVMHLHKVYWHTFQEKLLAVLFISLGVTFLLLSFLEYRYASQTKSLNLGGKFFYSFRTALKSTFELLSGDSDRLSRLAMEESLVSLPFFKYLAAFLTFFLPLLAAANLFLFLTRLLEITKLTSFSLPGKKRRIYVFSCLNTQYLNLIKSIHSHDHGNYVRIIFLRCTTTKKDLPPDTKQALMNVNYVLFPGNEQDLKLFSSHLWACIEKFFFISSSSDENFAHASSLLKLLPNEKKKPNFKKKGIKFKKKSIKNFFDTDDSQNTMLREIFVFSEDSSAHLLIDNLRNQSQSLNIIPYNIRLIDPSRAMCYYLLRTVPFFLSGTRKNGIMILGVGHFGSEFLRAATSSSVMYGFSSRFFLWDHQIDDRLAQLSLCMPEWDQDLDYERMDVDVTSNRFIDQFKNVLNDITYILISLGSDELNFQTTIQLGLFFRKYYWANLSQYQPQQSIILCVHIKNPQKSLSLDQWYKSNKQWPFRLYLFGDEEEMQSLDVLMPREIWYSAQTLQNNFMILRTGQQMVPKADHLINEYERRSSVAAVNHLIYHVASIQPEEEIEQLAYADRLTDSLLERWLEFYDNHYPQKSHELSEAEHLRWMKYVRSEGLCKAERRVVEAYMPYIHHHCDVIGRLSPCLVSFDQLTELSQYIQRLYDKHSIDGKSNRPPLSFSAADEYIVKNASSFLRPIFKNFCHASQSLEFSSGQSNSD